jgi:hypothetical protein
MAATKSEMNEINPKINERIFLLCDRCLWTVTCLTKKYLDELTEISETEYTCPICNQGPLSSFPVSSNDSYIYSHSKNKGLEVTLGTKSSTNRL